MNKRTIMERSTIWRYISHMSLVDNLVRRIPIPRRGWFGTNESMRHCNLKQIHLNKYSGIWVRLIRDEVGGRSNMKKPTKYAIEMWNPNWDHRWYNALDYAQGSYQKSYQAMRSNHTPLMNFQRREDWLKGNDHSRFIIFLSGTKCVRTSRSNTAQSYKWVIISLMRIMRYKARLMAQGFSQRRGIDNEETHSLVMDVIMFTTLSV